MLNINTIPARNLQKSYKSIIEDVKLRRKAVVLTTNNKPQAAIISLVDLEEFQKAKAKLAAQEMLELAIGSKKELKRLPANLRKKANSLLYQR